MARRRLVCTTVPGAGAGYTRSWSLNFNGYDAPIPGPAETTCSYDVSTNTSISGAAALALAGGSVVELTGTNFGPLGTPITASTSAVCVVTTPHIEATCTYASFSVTGVDAVLDGHAQRCRWRSLERPHELPGTARQQGQRA